MKLSIIIPCFNEAETIENTVRRVLHASLPPAWTREIIIVDDGSYDATSSILRHVSDSTPGVQVVRMEQNRGKGAAVKKGLKLAAGDYVILQDADSEYDPNDYAALLAPIVEGRAESVFGSRVSYDNNVSYNAIFFYGGLLVTKLFNMLFGTRLTDIATCYKIFPRHVIPSLLESPHEDFVFDAVDLTYVLLKNCRIAEVPIRYAARNSKQGKKLNAQAGVEIVLAIFLRRLGIPQRHHLAGLQIARFIVSGLTALVINLSVLYILTEYVHMWYLLSSMFSFVVAFAANFIMQKYWTFRNRNTAGVRWQLPLHLSVAIANLCLNVILLFLFVEYAHLWYLFAQVLATAIIAAESFVALRWIFR